ncbi:MAG TPA: hypothetical protein VHD56_16285 [Tepidisphaeraceae bacterium]|nr:hypothetical protein [Tepidisphaeraceae bacterium]
MKKSQFSVVAFLFIVQGALSGFAQTEAPIDRQAVVSRHKIVVNSIDPYGAMAVGNGEIAFNVDVTGLQSFPEYYTQTTPIGILSTWGWHSFPNPQNFTLDKFKFTVIKKFDRTFEFPSSSTSNAPPDAAYLRGNPHRLGLGRIGLEMTHADGSKVAITDLKNLNQTLDIWTGIMTSSFEVDGAPVHVTTAAHWLRDEMATRIESPLIASGHLKVRIAFGYATDKFGPDYQDWNKPDAHQTVFTAEGKTGGTFARTLDGMKYNVRTRWSPDVTIAETGKHQYLLTGTGNKIEFTGWFSPETIVDQPDSVDDLQAASSYGWKNYWMKGGIIDLSGNEDPRAAELERRLVLSQYVMMVHDGGSYPGAETGLAANSWYGKYHMEMYWFHAAHWGLWGHPEILERSLKGLKRMMPPGQKMAALEKSKGVKWSKMTDPTGEESPSGIGPALVWQQPHPIYLAELAYRATQRRETLEQFKDIVFETADYMATFVDFDPVRQKYVLGPGISSADEGRPNYAANMNPAMELGYWKWALKTAQSWRQRLGMEPEPTWQKVIDNISPPPMRNGVYVTLEVPEENTASWMATWLCGPIPGDGIDHEAIHKTLLDVTRARVTRVLPDITWGFGMEAMCAARLNEPEIAVSLLVPKYNPNANVFRPSGYSVRRAGPPPMQTPMYMPANGAWLSAAAMMAAGWDGNTGHAPGFPKNWKVRYEGLYPTP